MNVFLDAQPLLGPRSGIHRYVECLAGHLANLEGIDLTLAFNRLLKPLNSAALPNSVQGIKTDNTPYPYKVIRRLMRPNPLYALPFDLLSFKKADLFHGTNFTHVPHVRGKTVITIHDLAYMHYPESTSEKIYKHHTRWVPYSARKADRIIADSEQTKSDIMDLLDISPDKIDVVYIAADESFHPLPQSQVQTITKKYNLPESYILFVGTLEPRKNLTGLLQAYELLRKNSAAYSKLVIVGAKGWKYSPIFDQIIEHGMESDVIFTGYVEDHDLAAIYNAASMLVLPSIYEGFGLPLLEAMQCGVPVIGSDVSSIPEVIGDCGLLVKPGDTEGWAKAMHVLLTDKETHTRYSRLALQRAEQFHWRKVAQETKRVYDKAMSE